MILVNHDTHCAGVLPRPVGASSETPYTGGRLTISPPTGGLEVTMNALRSLTALLLALGLMLAAASPALPQSNENLEPDITIRQEEERIIREYRVNGELYAIEIRPSAGPSYYLVDHDGDGNFERQEGDRIAVPEWVLKTF